MNKLKSINPKYGAILGRLRPFHKGHESLVEAVKAKGLIPIIIVGSAQESRTKKNPYSAAEVSDMIRCVYPEMLISHVDDDTSWEKWVDNLLGSIPVPLDECTLIVHNKEEDRMDFTYKGIEFKNSFYSEIYEHDNIHTTTVNTPGIPVRATLIRKDLEKYKYFLSECVYNYIRKFNES